MHHTIKSKMARTAAIAMVAAAATGTPGMRAWGAAPRAIDSGRQVRGAQFLIAQDDSGDEPEVPQSQVDKYIAVYKAMQRDHSITAEQAAMGQGLTISQFRALENRIMDNGLLREQVRRALRKPTTDAKPVGGN